MFLQSNPLAIGLLCVAFFLTLVLMLSRIPDVRIKVALLFFKYQCFILKRRMKQLKEQSVVYLDLYRYGDEYERLSNEIPYDKLEYLLNQIELINDKRKTMSVRERALSEKDPVYFDLELELTLLLVDAGVPSKDIVYAQPFDKAKVYEMIRNVQ